jgi:hypothetical protein
VLLDFCTTTRKAITFAYEIDEPQVVDLSMLGRNGNEHGPSLLHPHRRLRIAAA